MTVIDPFGSQDMAVLYRYPPYSEACYNEVDLYYIRHVSKFTFEWLSAAPLKICFLFIYILAK